MSNPAVTHSTFTLERRYPAPPARVFAAFANLATKQKWFAPGHGAEVIEHARSPEALRVGAREVTRSRFGGGPPGAPPVGTVMTNETVYLDIVEHERIVFAYTMAVGDYRMSASLATVELVADGEGTRLTFTEQAAFFERSDGEKLRAEGWRALLARLDEALR